MKRLISFLFIAFFAVSTQAHESKTHVSLSLDQGIYSDYVWRGLNFNDDGVNQGAIDVSVDAQDLGTFGFNIWYNMDLSDNDDYGVESDVVTEIDYTLYWEKSFDIFTLGAGYIYYDFPEADDADTREIYVSAGFDVILAPGITVYRDIDANDGYYVDLAIGHDFEITEGYTLSVGANLGWADEKFSEANYGTDEDGFTNYALSASMDFGLNDYITLTPSIMYYGLLDDAEDVREDGGLDDEDGFVFGVNLNVSF